MSKTGKKKDFDCVEMKNEIQAKILADYEEKKGEFKSFTDYVTAQCEESPWAKGIISKIKKAHKSPKSA